MDSDSATPSVSPPFAAESNQLWSRNGRRLACNPCRRRKLACDHSLPVCQRCSRSKTAEQCTYSKSRMTTSRLAYPAGDAQAVTQDVSGSAVWVKHPTGDVSAKTGVASTDIKYLGATSLLNLFQEPHASLLSFGDGTQPFEGYLTESIPTAATTLTQCSPHKLALGLEMLNSLPDPAVAKQLIQEYRSPVDAWLRPTISYLSDNFFSTFEPHIDVLERRSRLEQIVQILIQNSDDPLEEEQDNAKDWLSSFSGHSFRWEGLGVLFVYWAIGMLDKSSDVARAALQRYLQCAEGCLELCRRTHHSNSLILYFLLKYAHLSSTYHGDASLESIRIISEAICVATSLGVHITPPAATSTISLPSQLQRRLFAHLYILDKVRALVTGRPPLLFWRYCSTPLPLDVSDETILQFEGAMTADDVSKLYNIDESGWNTTGAVYNATLMRARVLMARVREDILDMALGVAAAPDIHRLWKLKTDQLNIYESLPSVLHYDNNRHNQDLHTPAASAKSLIRLEHLQNIFFINRMFAKASSELEYNRQLVETSSDMLGVALAMWAAGHRPIKHAFNWVVVSYACPAAGVLCNELLKPDSFLFYAAQHGQLPLRRSDVVQQLSLLSGFLSSMGSSAPNASLWAIVKEVIHRVLDLTLNGPPPGMMTSQFDGRQNLQAQFPESAVSEDFQEVFAFELLDSFEWLHTEYMTPPQ